MEAELSVPEGWMVEKDEQGIEVFLSPDGTSLPSRRFDKFYFIISTLFIVNLPIVGVYLFPGHYFRVAARS